MVRLTGRVSCCKLSLNANESCDKHAMFITSLLIGNDINIKYPEEYSTVDK